MRENGEMRKMRVFTATDVVDLRLEIVAETCNT